MVSAVEIRAEKGAAEAAAAILLGGRGVPGAQSSSPKET